MSATLINQSSGNVEWYTPFEIVNAGRVAVCSDLIAMLGGKYANGSQ